MKTTSSSKIIVIVVSLFVALAALGYGAYTVYLDSKPFDIEVQLSDELRADYEAKVVYFSEQLQVPDPNSPDGLPNADFYIEKARYLGYLGRLSQAEAVLKESLKKFNTFTVAEHNLGRLYEQMQKYDKALDRYEKLADPTIYNQPQYYFDIARIKRIQNDVAGAEKAYKQHLAKFNSPDAEFEQWLRDNKK